MNPEEIKKFLESQDGINWKDKFLLTSLSALHDGLKEVSADIKIILTVGIPGLDRRITTLETRAAMIGGLGGIVSALFVQAIIMWLKSPQ